MGMTIVEKILARAAGRGSVRAGEIVTAPVDCAVMLDTTFFFLNQMRRDILKVADPDKLVIVFDHEVPAPSAVSAAAQAAGRAFAQRWRVKRFHDIGRDQGISHALVADNAYAAPGSLLIGSDSHSPSAGAMNCAARAVTILDLLYTVATGRTWMALGETVRCELTGSLSGGASAMDVFLHMAGTIGGLAGLSIEYGGPGLADLSLGQRRTISTMSTELNVDFATFEADERLLDHVRARNHRPFQPVFPDPDASYRARHAIALDAVRPMVALPDKAIGNTAPVDDALGEPIDQAFIGSCANGSLSDIADAAAILRGRRIASNVRLIVTPATQAIYREALAAGYLATLSEAGAIVTPSTCGACAGGHLGVLGPNESCITSSTRNFKGRMGDPTARIFLASPATVAASAAAGAIAHPGEFLS